MANEKLFYIGVKGLIKNSQGHILLLLADITNHRKVTEPYWDIPGGRIEQGASLIDTLAREISEETGVDINVSSAVQLATVISKHQIPVDATMTAGLALVIYSVTIPDESIITISSEHERYEWVDKIEAKQRLANKYPTDFTDHL